MLRLARRTAAVLAVAAAAVPGMVAVSAPASASTHPAPRVKVTHYLESVNTCPSSGPCNAIETVAPAYRVLGDRIAGRSAYVALVGYNGVTIKTWKVATQPVSGGRRVALDSGYFECQGYEPDAWFGIYDAATKKWSTKAPVAVMCDANGFGFA